MAQSTRPAEASSVTITDVVDSVEPTPEVVSVTLHQPESSVQR